MPKTADVSIGSTATAFAVLESLLELDEPGVSAVATHIEVPKSTAHDYLQSLRALGYVRRTEAGYRLGVRFLEFGESARRELQIFDIARSELDRLAADTGEHANLMIEEHGMGIFLYKSTGEDAIHLDTHPGMRVHLHTTALGKTILAHMPTNRVEEILDEHGLPTVTDETIDTREELFETLQRVRERGYSIDNEERVAGTRCIAAPIIDDGTVVAAVSASGPLTRFQGERFETELPNRVRSAANAIEVNMAHS